MTESEPERRQLSAADAERLWDEFSETRQALVDVVVAVVVDRAWLALGYDSWDQLRDVIHPWPPDDPMRMWLNEVAESAGAFDDVESATG